MRKDFGDIIDMYSEFILGIPSIHTTMRGGGHA